MALPKERKKRSKQNVMLEEDWMGNVDNRALRGLYWDMMRPDYDRWGYKSPEESMKYENPSLLDIILRALGGGSDATRR